MNDLPTDPSRLPDEPPDDAALEALDDDEQDDDAIELDAPRGPLADYQFRLIGLLGAMTACGVYFGLERMHRGRFGAFMLLGTALTVGLAVPGLLFLLWILRSVFDGGISLGTLLFVVLSGAALALFLSQF